MGEIVLLVVGHLGEGSSIALVRDEKRIETESPRTTFMGSNRSFTYSLDHRLAPVGPTHHHHGHESGPSSRLVGASGVLQGVEEFSPVRAVGIGGVLGSITRVSSRPNSEFTGQRIDEQSGVVGDRGPTGGRQNRVCFEASIAFERRRVLHHIGSLDRTRQQIHEWRRTILRRDGQDLCDLGHLVGIGRRADEDERRIQRLIGRRTGSTAIISDWSSNTC